LLLREPQKYLLQRWNRKSAVLSSLLRASLFSVSNLTAGLPAAIAAMKTALVFRGITSGFYGADRSISRGGTAVGGCADRNVPAAGGESLHRTAHWLRGTQKLFPSTIASVILTAFSTL
jgi:hypothetical protein